MPHVKQSAVDITVNHTLSHMAVPVHEINATRGTAIRRRAHTDPKIAI